MAICLAHAADDDDGGERGRAPAALRRRHAAAPRPGAREKSWGSACLGRLGRLGSSVWVCLILGDP